MPTFLPDPAPTNLSFRLPPPPGRHLDRGATLPVAHARSWRDLITTHSDDLATIMTMECGKPLAEAKAEIASG